MDHKDKNETWVPPGHYYSPLVDPADRHARTIIDNFSDLDLALPSGLLIDDQILLATLNQMSRFYADLPFPKAQARGTRYYYNNQNFEWGDAVVYFCMIRSLRPKRIFEIGSGFSSCIAMDTNDLFFGGSIDLQFIEPYPERLIALIGRDETYRPKLRQVKTQDVATSVFQQLEANDILFIDSSHVAKLGSDVNDYMFRILPALAPGVIVHIHDIFYPFEYPPEWIVNENRSWNEAYLLHAFLQYNPSFQIVYFNHYVYRKFGQLVEDKMPLVANNPGGSLWLERIR